MINVLLLEYGNCALKSVQYLPKLLINGVLIPCVEMSESFRYLGRFFDFNMSNHQHMSELSSLVQDLMNDIDIKPLHPKHKLLLYSRYVLSKLSWHFTTIITPSRTLFDVFLVFVVVIYIFLLAAWNSYNILCFSFINSELITNFVTVTIYCYLFLYKSESSYVVSWLPSDLFPLLTI